MDNSSLKDFLFNKVKSKPHLCNIVHLNAQSLNETSHYDEFCFSFVNSGVSIIAVSETFFKPGSRTELPGYNVFRNDRIGKGGGGVAVYIKQGIKAKVLSTSQAEYCHRPEYIIMEITFQSTSILFACMYRPPKIGYLDGFIEDLYNYITNYEYLIMCGDVNARFGSGSGETENIVSMLITCNVECIPFGDTYHTSTCDSALDIIATNCIEILLDYDKVPAAGFSSHDLLFACFDISTPRSKPKTIYYRNYKNIDIEGLQHDATHVQWQRLYECDTIDNKVECFNRLLIDLYDKHAPVKSFKSKYNDKPWMNGQIVVLMQMRDDARKIFAKSKTQDNYENFRQLRNKCNQHIRNAKLRYFKEVFHEAKTSKEVWAGLRSLGVGKSKLNQVCTLSPEVLNKHYLGVASVSNEKLVKDCIDKYRTEYNVPNRELFNFKYVLPEDVINAIDNVSSKAEGVDGISITMLKMCLPVIVPALCHIFDFSLQHGIFPDIWKRAQVIPIPKLSAPVEPKDYRPVSIICVLAKVFEKIVHKQVSDYASEHNVINNNQSGFRKGHNTTTTLIKVTDEIRQSIDNRKLTLLILFDFSKAFDKVHHELLLVKLKLLGFSQLVINWFSSYLTERSQRVFIDIDLVSTWAHIITGVPQGSVLGPLLYLLYVNDLADIFEHGNADLYADDLQYRLFFTLNNISTAVKLAEYDSAKLVGFAASHNLSINAGKTQPMIIGTRKYLNELSKKEIPLVSISGQTIQYCKTAVNLGITFDQTLCWNAHVDSLCKKVLSILCQLRRNSLNFPLEIKKLIVNSIVFPHLDYGAVIMEDMHEVYKIKMQRLQNACIRFIFNLSKGTHITKYYRELGWLKIEQRRKYNKLSLLHSVLKYRTPSYMYDKFEFMCDVHERSNRYSKMLLRIPQHRTEKYGKSYLISTSKLFNTYDIASLLNLSHHTYKNKIKKLLYDTM